MEPTVRWSLTQREKGSPVMTDLPEDEWTNPNTPERPGEHTVTHEELAAETKTVLTTLAREMEKVRDQLYHLNKTHTVALMAAEMYVHLPNFDNETAARIAKVLYREVQKTLETDNIITGHIPAA
ncbi:hypothetical protein LCGC14_1932710 [marine sediment metagenome]|uniref:Uncharacterized protein n=1 Tax=marine sediment metagenome TaxID=412755 RepID=A0A0F9FN24_9ZZZZ